MLKKIGEILHIAGSGRVIISIDEPIEEGQILCDKTGTRVAKVMELIGPTRDPLASAIPLTNNIKKHVGKVIFAIHNKQQQQHHHPQQQKSNKRQQFQQNTRKTRRRETR